MLWAHLQVFLASNAILTYLMLCTLQVGAFEIVLGSAAFGVWLMKQLLLFV